MNFDAKIGLLPVAVGRERGQLCGASRWPARNGRRSSSWNFRRFFVAHWTTNEWISYTFLLVQRFVY
jgi:hypothetical protein